VDYARRRRALAGFDTIDHAVWEPVFSRFGVPLPQPRCLAVAAWLWAELTCDEVADAPAISNPAWSTASFTSRLRSARRMSDHLPAELAEELLAFGRSLADTALPPATDQGRR
jgi:hypothetical protein